MTEQEAYAWLEANEYLVMNATKMEPQQFKEFFEVYNTLSPVKKQQTSCARCIHNMRVYLQAHIKQINNMQQYLVYRTAKGTLTFKPNGDSIFTIKCNSKLAADEALAQLKAFEKRENKLINE
jgi:bacterioferritin-associated ferredoxin